MDNSVHSSDEGVDRGADKSVQGSVHSSASISQSQQDLQPPKNIKELKSAEGANKKNEQPDAVRRPFDAERRLINRSAFFSPSAKSQKLAERLAAKIKKSNDLFADYVRHCESKGEEHPYGEDEKEAFAALKYEPDLKSPLLSWSFVHAVVTVYDENRDKGLSPGILCCKVIDYCERETKAEKTLSSQGGFSCDGYYYPPDFKEHRNQLRARERRQEQDPTSERKHEVRDVFPYGGKTHKVGDDFTYKGKQYKIASINGDKARLSSVGGQGGQAA